MLAPEISSLVETDQVDPARSRGFALTLWLGVILLNLLVIGLAANSINSGWGSYVERARTATQNLSLLLERELTDNFDNMDLALRNLADAYAANLRTGPFSADRWNAQLRRQRSYLPVLSGLRGIDSSGQIVYGFDEDEPSTASVADRDFFVTHRDNPDAGLLISRPAFSRVTGQWSFVVSRRLNDRHGNFTGAVALTVPLATFAQRFAALKIGGQGSIALRDGGLRLTVRHPELANGGAIGSTGIAEEFTAALLQDRAVGGYHAGASSIDGVRRLHSYRHNRQYDFYIDVGVAEDDYLARWRSDCVKTGAVTSLFLLCSIVFSIVLRRSWVLQGVLTNGLLLSESRFHKMFKHSDSVMLLVEPASGDIVDANDAAARFYGYPVEHLKGMTISQISALPADEIAKNLSRAVHHQQNFFIVRHRVADGSMRNVEVRSSPIRVEERDLLFSIVHDITEHTREEQQVTDLPFHDLLTQLPNRRLLLDRLGQALAATSRHGREGALLYINLDGFKFINDMLGHGIGDLLLQEVAHRLEACVRQGDTLARLGGDEFIVMLEYLDEDHAQAVSQAGAAGRKILASLGKGFQLEGHDAVCTSSIGIALFRNQSKTAIEVLRQANKAMYQAKREGRNALRFYEPETDPA